MILDGGWTLSGVDTFTAEIPATVPGTVGRIALRSAKSALRDWAPYLG